jgi:hypothetical protein
MAITLQIPPDVERQLRTRAANRGLGLSEFVLETLLRASEKPVEEPEQATHLPEEASPWRGVFTVSPGREEFQSAIAVDWAEPSSNWKPEIILDPSRARQR